MSIVILEGPEKAGKSTLARLIQAELGGRVRHWTGQPEHDKVYAEALAADCKDPDELVIWDRGWVSESVYDLMLDRGRHLGRDPWHGEWMYGRTVQSFGARVILLGPSESELNRLRTPDDLSIPVHAERREFEAYGRRFGWWVVENDHDEASNLLVLEHVRRTLAVQRYNQMPPPPVYCGPACPRILFVGEQRTELLERRYPGAWLPFTSRYTTEYGRILGDLALECGWSNAFDCPPEVASRAELVVACGAVAQKWAVDLRHPRVVNVPHPSWLFRWGGARESRAVITKLLREVISGY